MSTAEPEVRAKSHRIWIPLLLVVLAAASIGILQMLPEESLDSGQGNTLSMGIGLLASVLVLVWFFLLSGFSWLVRLSGLSALVVGLYLVFPPPAGGFVVRRIEFNGFMTPNLRFAWEDDEEALVRHRRLASGGRVDEVDLANVSEDDMAEYRGARRDGIVPGPELASVWSEGEPKRLWRQPVGGGYSAFSTVGPWAVTIEQRKEDEAVVCYDTLNGGECWSYSYPAHFQETLGGNGPRATPTIHGGRVYSLGATGELVCLEGSTGKAIWTTNILRLNESENLTWGMSGSPLVLEGKVIVTPGSQKGSGSSRAILALDASNGEVAWKSGQALGGYASPMVAELLGQEQILSFEGERIASYSSEDGEELWQHPWKSDYDVNAAQPIVVDAKTVLISSNSGTALLRIGKDDEGWSATPEWTSRDLKCHYSNPILFDGHVYGLDNGIMACIRLADGKRTWKGGRYGHGQMLLRGRIFLVLSEKGELAMVEATPDEFHELGKIQALDAFKTWNNPTLVGRRLLVRNHLEMAAFELPVE